MAAQKHTMLQSQDSDSGLSMPSGTLRSSFNFTGSTLRMAEEDHERLIETLLRKSTDDAPVPRSAFTTPYQSNRNGSRLNTTLDETFLQPQRSSSPDISKSHSVRVPLSQLRHTSWSHGATQSFRRSADQPFTFTGMTDGYMTAGLNSALNESQSRRNALVDKLKEAQDTLQLQSGRLTKMETDYHSSSYQVEELKASESKLLRHTSELENRNQELNEMRLRDIDTQIVLQDRVKELEGALLNMATDFQLLEADHARRRELVDQLSTTVELIEEENRKLHKMEQSINTEVQSLRNEIISANEKTMATKQQLDAQRRETKHWKEESEKQLGECRAAQELVSELKGSKTSLTHKLESQEDKERQLLKESESLRAKERELHDTMTDLKSRVAILSSDKERLYQEKSDLGMKIDEITLFNRQLQEEVQELQLASKTTAHEVQIKNNSISQLTSTNQQLTDELSGSQKVGERLSLELTKSKELVEKYEEELSRNRVKLQNSEETIQSLRINCKETQLELMKLQTETEYMKENVSQEKKNQHVKIEQLQTQITHQEEQRLTLEKNIADRNSKLATCQESSSHQITNLQSEVKSWKDKTERSLGSMQRKEDEIVILSQKLSDYESQVNSLMIEQDAHQIDYDNYKHLQEENQRLILQSRRVTQENSETEQMVQLLQTQRDIYARTVQEYSGKAVQADSLTEENKQLHSTIESLRESQSNMEEEMQAHRDLKISFQKKISSSKETMENLKKENVKYRYDKEQAEQESLMLKNAVQESYQLRQQMQRLEADMAACNADKSVITHLSEQSTQLNQQLTASTSEAAQLIKVNQNLDEQLSELKRSESKLTEEIKQLNRTVNVLKQSNETFEGQVLKFKEQFTNVELERNSLDSQLTKLQAQSSRAEKQLEDQRELLARATPLESTCHTLQKNVEELSARCHSVTTDRDSLSGQVTKLELELQLANRNIEERLQANKQLTFDLTRLVREKENLQIEVERLERKLVELRESADMQLKSVNSRYEQSEGCRLESQQRLRKAEQDANEWVAKYKALSAELSAKSDEMASLRSTVESLNCEVENSANVVCHQEELISTLKEEVAIIPDINSEMRDLKARFTDVQMLSEEHSNTISTLNKEAEQKEELERQLQDIGTDLIAVKNELQRTYSSMNQKELDMERLQQQYSNAMLDADNSEDKCAEIKIRLEQTEKAKDVALSTLQERIHSLEDEVHTYKTEVIKLERLLKEMNGQLNSTSDDLNLSRGFSVLNKESLVSITAERDSLYAQSTSLRSQNTKLLTQQNYLEGEKRKAQLELKETKMDMFKVEKEKRNLESSNARLDNSLSESNRLLKTLTAEYETTTSRLTDYERTTKSLKRDHAYVKDDLNEHIEQLKREKEQLQMEVRDLRIQVSKLQAQLREVDFANAKSPAMPQHAISIEQESSPAKTTANGDTSTVSLEVPREITNSKSGDIKDSVNSKSNPISAATETLECEKEVNKLILSEVETDSSGDSWPDPHSLPELSDTMSFKGQDSQPFIGLTKLQGTDLTDGQEANGSPLRVTELPVTLSLLDPLLYSSLSPRATQCKFLESEQPHNTASDSDDTHSDKEDGGTVDEETEHTGGHNSQLSMTRDKTMKIFKQLKKAKQRSRKCLAPTPKLTKSLPDIPTVLQNQCAAKEEGRPAADESMNVEHVKEDIIAKSGRVEWRGDPREPHRRYLSSWDLSIISDAEEGDSLVETESVSSDYTRSLLNIASGPAGSVESMQSVGAAEVPSSQKVTSVNQSGSMDSMQSIGTLDGPSISKTSDSSTIKGIPSLDQISLNPNSLSMDDIANSSEITPINDEVNRSRIPVTSSPKASPQLVTRGIKDTKDCNSIPSKPQKKGSRSSDGKTRLPKLSLFKKKS